MALYDPNEFGKIFNPIFLFIFGLFVIGLVFLLGSSIINDEIAHKFVVWAGITLTISGMMGTIMSCVLAFIILFYS